ncbi:reverse transcriptase domain-containing protein [Tanacetum coccineum]
MRTRSSSNLIVESSTIPKRRNRRCSKQIVIVETSFATMADTRTMSELLQAPTEGYRDAIVIPAILAKNFKLKVGLLMLITSSLKYKNVPHDAIKLMLFPFSLEGAAHIWLEKEPPRSIHTWEDLVSKFVNYFFPLSKPTNLKNDITNFQQRFDETFSEAWDRFKDLLRKCPHHGFSELHQIDTFYNALTQSDQDSLNAAAGVSSTTSSPSLSLDVTALTEIVKELVLMNKATQQATMKALEETCVTCGGPHPYYECLATGGNTFDACAAVGTYNQGELVQSKSRNYQAPNNQGFNQQRGQNFNIGNNNYQAPNYQAPNNQAQVGPSNELSNYMKSNEATLRSMQTQMSNMKSELRNEFKSSFTNQFSSIETKTNKLENQNNQIRNMLNNLTIQRQSPSGLGSLPSDTVANPRGELKAITTGSGVSYDGSTIPPTSSPLSKEAGREPEATKDKVQTINLGSTAHVQPSVIQVSIPEPDVAPKPNPKPSFPYPSRINDQKLREKANNQMLKFLQIFQRLHFDLSFADSLLHMHEFDSTFKSLLSNKEKLFELANTPLNGDPGKFLFPCDFPELDECLALADLGASINLMPISVWKKLSLPELTPTRMTLELANQSVAYLVGVAEDVFVKVGKFHFLADFVVVDYDVDPWVPLILGRPFLRTTPALIDVHGEELTLQVNDEAIPFNVGHTSRYSYIYDDESVNQIDVIDVTCEEYAQEGGDFVLEEIKACHTSDSIPPGIDDADFDLEGDIILLEMLLNDDPSSPLPPKELNFEELKIIKSSIDDPPELELKDLPSHFEYAFLEETDK